MLTLQQFRALTDTYGAAPERWPEAMRAEAEALLTVSPQSRSILAEARILDEEIDAARAHDDATLLRPGEQEAALARLRTHVAAQLASAERRVPLPPRSASWLWMTVGGAGLGARLGWVGMATTAFILAAGLVLGSLYTPSPSQEDVLTLLQPDPIPFLAEQ